MFEFYSRLIEPIEDKPRENDQVFKISLKADSEGALMKLWGK